MSMSHSQFPAFYRLMFSPLIACSWSALKQQRSLIRERTRGFPLLCLYFQTVLRYHSYCLSYMYCRMLFKDGTCISTCTPQITKRRGTHSVLKASTKPYRHLQFLSYSHVRSVVSFSDGAGGSLASALNTLTLCIYSFII